MLDGRINSLKSRESYDGALSGECNPNLLVEIDEIPSRCAQRDGPFVYMGRRLIEQENPHDHLVDNLQTKKSRWIGTQKFSRYE